jgi:hypothetical protein
MRYLHVRPGQFYNPDTRRLEGHPEPKSGMTVAWDAADPSGNVLKIGLALCHTNDSYDRKKGRIIASGRVLCDRPTDHTFLLANNHGVPETEQVLEFLYAQGRL